MEFFSSRLVSHEFVDRLSADLKNASVCRFLVAYVNHGGIDALGRAELLRLLRNSRSFGVSSLDCSCGYEPLLRLHKELGEGAPRLKYFMNPLERKSPESRGEPLESTLLHSKLVYLYLHETQTSVVYIGSHNWTKAALGKHKPRNAEASLRIEMPYVESHLAGTGTSIVDQVNQHLLAAFNCAACYPAVSANKQVFEDWYQVGCATAAPSEFEQLAVVLAIRTAPETPLAPSDWLTLDGRSIYAQILDPPDGTIFRRNFEKILVLVWESLDDFRQGGQPVLLRCRISTQNPGKGSENRGSNVAENPIEGFLAILFDANQLHSKQSQRRASASINYAKSGLQFEYFDFEFPAMRSRAADVDGLIDPPDQFLLEVEAVVLPAKSYSPSSGMLSRMRPELVWEPNSLAFAASRTDAKLEKLPGYRVTEKEVAAVLKSLEQEFGVDLRLAKALPAADTNVAKLGLRIAAHPIHEIFLESTNDQEKEAFYKDVERGWLTADLDLPSGATNRSRKKPKPERRTQRVFSMGWKELAKTWFATARRLDDEL